jgi:hypothetical protein
VKVNSLDKDEEIGNPKIISAIADEGLHLITKCVGRIAMLFSEGGLDRKTILMINFIVTKCKQLKFLNPDENEKNSNS